MPAPLPPVDPDVKVPASVAAAAAAADAIHKQAYPQPEPLQPEPEPAPAAASAVPAPAPQPAPPPAPSPEPPAPQPVAGQYPDKNSDLTLEQWRHQYLSMKGRYEQAANSIGVFQEQMSELGDELVRTQQELARTRQGQPAPRTLVPAPQLAQALLTDEEMRAYGPELIDVIQRAARAAVMPDLQNVQTGVQQVQQRVQQVSTGGLYTQLDAEVPDWRAINISERFKQWCGLRDVYSGQLRGRLLNAAFQAADAPRVVAFFKGFLAEEQATGQLPDPSLQPPPPAVPRQAAIPLGTLTAPGRAKPAGSGEQPLPVDKPIFSRAQIASFYADVRAGRYAGRDQDKAVTEQAIFAAQREGRIR